ncbi:CVNH domain-containing protein [Mastigocoleus sp. MO_188.B34]|uniref:mannose-binding lectin n=1 Tax=Mastigocoleus sp. MO_188.B34 TaxID=3036635 RepID=UPI002634A58F|nr:CVNH domain-containing protein [Mastigocoleus sp. MO_188.B34]
MKEKVMVKIQKNSFSVLNLMLLFIVLASFNPFGSQALAGGFANTCKRVRVSGSWLSARCKTRRANYKNTGINLNNFVTNRNGYLRFSNRGGNFSASCKNIRIAGKSTLRADCRTFQRDYRNTSLNLNGRITNRNGTLDFD